MSFFIAEKEVERLLEYETRTLERANGSRFSVTAFRVAWSSFEFVLACRTWSEHEIVAMIESDARALGKTFEEYFPGAMGYMHARILGKPVPE